MNKVIVLIALLFIGIVFSVGYEMLKMLGLNLWGYTITLMIGFILTEQIGSLLKLNK